MSAQVLWCGAARRSLCSSCLLSRRTSAYYSQSVAGRIQNPEASISATQGAWSNSHLAVANVRNPLDPTRLDRYLASIEVADLEPTLDDIERCKPGNFAQPNSSRYAAEYTSLLETLCRSFSKDQLRHFTEIYKLDPIWTRSSRRKTEYAESIIEKAWGWPSLKEIERKRRDTTEVLVKAFIVTPSQLFLIMGRDGVDLLQLSTQYNVHISLTSSPLALRVEGLRGSLKGLTEYISSLKKGIIDEIFELPTGRPVRPDLLQRISRLAGAYVENHGHRGKVRICAKYPNDIVTAKRLALRAALEVGTQARTVCFDTPNEIRDSPVTASEPHRYTVYPFFTPSPFPWAMHSGGAFRLRRVTDWLGVDTYEDVAATGGLADNSHRLLNLDQGGEELSQLVCPDTPESTSYCQRIITASFGHILISSCDEPQRASIFTPLRGTLSLPDTLKWVETSGTPLAFVPSVPPAMMTAVLGDRRALHRLVYRTLPEEVSKFPQHVLKLEVKFSGFLATRFAATQENALNYKDMPSSDELVPNANPVSSSSGSENLPEAFGNGWESSCQVGKETYVNLMLPDRPIDMQLSIFNWDDLSSIQQPAALRDYAEKFCSFSINKAYLSQPDPPSTFSYEGKTYYLHESLTLKQSGDSSLLSTPSDANADSSVEVCNESITDLQSTQKMELGQVKFRGTVDGPSWRRFLAACDQLTLVSLPSRSKDKPRAVYLGK